MRAPTYEHSRFLLSTETSSAPRGGEAIGLLLPKDPYWLLRQACGPGGSVESFLCSTVSLFEFAADLQFVRTGHSRLIPEPGFLWLAPAMPAWLWTDRPTHPCKRERRISYMASIIDRTTSGNEWCCSALGHGDVHVVC